MIPRQDLYELGDASRMDWDVIIVGGGMGGASVAYSLSKNGHRVLLIERGSANFPDAKDGIMAAEEAPEKRLASCRWPEALNGSVDGLDVEFWPPLGCGIGGSTLIYAAAMQRLRESEFQNQTLPSGASISWPFTYDALKPYYRQAETLFSVSGTADPLCTLNSAGGNTSLKPPPAMCERDRHYFREFKNAGYHPYRLPVAFAYESDCQECGGKICKRNCKRDARNALVFPAIKTGKLCIVENTEITGISASDSRVESVCATKNGRSHELTAPIVVLAAGAYFSPVLLLRSLNKQWPEGLANSSGLVGKNLMFHAGDIIAVWPRKNYSREGPNKTIAFRDFYEFEGEKYGEFQSTGLSASYDVLLHGLRMEFEQSRLRKIPLVKPFLRIPAFIASKIYGDASVFATIIEDYPYDYNRIIHDPRTKSGMRFEYTFSDELKERIVKMRRTIMQSLPDLKSVQMNPSIVLNYGHPCGTCKAGVDPATSVIDENCKTHDLDNLYIVDASFFPTSGGTNPSLTIAANALRVADVIDLRLRETA